MKNLEALTRFFDSQKNNTEIARKIRESGAWNYKDEQGRKIVAKYRKQLEEAEPQDVRSLEDLIKAASIDTTKFEIKQYNVSKKEVGGKDRYEVSARMEPKFTPDYQQTVDRVIQRKLYTVEKKNLQQAPRTLVIELADLHWGKFARLDESGENYDLEIARERVLSALSDKMSEINDHYNLKKIYVINMGDYFHIDNKKSTTTKGTYVEACTSYQHIFETGVELMITILDYLSAFCEVSLINVFGNHDDTASYHLGRVLHSHYRNDDVEIDISNRTRKYFQIGSTAWMATHGDRRPQSLPLTFAMEYPNFSLSKFRMISVGHVHHQSRNLYNSEKESAGVVVRTCNSLSGVDKYHEQEGYISNKKLTFLVVDDMYGVTTEYHYNI